MDEYCQRFYFAKDMNGDLAFTISDVWLMAKFVWLLPSKIVMSIIDDMPRVAAFFETSCSTGDSWGGGIFSLFAWLIVLGVLSLVLENTF